MASQEVLDNSLTANGSAGVDDQGSKPGISLGEFQWTSVYGTFEHLEKHTRSDGWQIAPTPAPHRALPFPKGTFKRNGFNIIFLANTSADPSPPSVSAIQETDASH